MSAASQREQRGARGRGADEAPDRETTEHSAEADVDARCVWDVLLGPVHDAATMTRYLRHSENELADLAERRQLLALETSDGIVIYPAFQVDQFQLLPGLAEVLGVFAGVPVDGWTLSSWLLAPSESLDGLSVIDWLRTRRSSATAQAHAARAAWRWSP